MINKSLIALRKVLLESWKLGLIEREEYERATTFKGIPGRPSPRGRALTHKEVLKLAINCEEDDSPLGARDGAIVALLFFTGVRRFELAALTVEDWNPEAGEIMVRHGKGNRSRVVPVPDGVAAALVSPKA